MQPIPLATKAAHRRSLKRNTEGGPADVAPNAKQPPPPEEARAPSTVQQEASSFEQVLPVRITLRRGLSVRLTLKTRGCPIQEEQGNNHTAAPPPSRADQAAYTEDVEAGMRAHELKCRRLWDALALRLKAEMTRRRRHAEKQPEEADAADTKKLRAVPRIVPPPHRKSIVIPFSPYAKIPPLRDGLPSPKRVVFYYNKHRKSELPSSSSTEGPSLKRQKVELSDDVCKDPATYEWGTECDSSFEKRQEALQLLHSKLAIKRKRLNGRPSVKNFCKLPSHHHQRRLADYSPSLPPIAEVIDDENEAAPSC